MLHTDLTYLSVCVCVCVLAHPPEGCLSLAMRHNICFGRVLHMESQVFCFIMKEKGTSWAYATPGFGASLSASNLRQMRQLTGEPGSAGT